jgi:hypothetical protein
MKAIMTCELENKVWNALEEILHFNFYKPRKRTMRAYLSMAAKKIAAENLTEPVDSINIIYIAILFFEAEAIKYQKLQSKGKKK